MRELIGDDYLSTIPALPTTFDVHTWAHRDKIPVHTKGDKVTNRENIIPFPAMVARPVGAPEIAREPLAQKARDAEWRRLREQDVWDEENVREWDEVCAEAKANGTECHLAHLMGIMVEKGSELDKDDENRKYKFRVVFRGDQVKDQNWEAAMFQDLGSAPATMAASKMADAFGCIEGHSLMQADAVQAYVQAKITGPPTWVCLPKEVRPEAWAHMRKPVCLLDKALYGHPDAGTCWEDHCEKHLTSPELGFEPIDGWPSCFFQPKTKMFLIVYVDDFKLAGPKEHMDSTWNLIGKGLTIETPKAANLFLGCKHEQETVVLPSGTLASKITYNMQQHLESTVQRYYDLAGPIKGHSTTLRACETPFLPEDHKMSDTGRPKFIKGPHVCCPWCEVAIPIAAEDVDNAKLPTRPQCAACMRSQFDDVELPALSAPKGASTGYNKHPVSSTEASSSRPTGKKKYKKPTEEVDEQNRGKLQSIAARVLMKLLYCARMARFDLLRPVCHLACHVSKWTSECDKRLHRLICYVNSTLHRRMLGWVGDTLKDVQPHLYADADFAGCTSSQKSTNGVHHVLRGPNTCFPLEGVSKRQSCVSVSTTEAEIVAGFFALKTVGIPSLMIWERLLPGDVSLTVHEDNQAMIRVCHTGRNPTMRYLSRVHRISIAWLYERFGAENIHLCYTDTKLMAADIYTKAFSDPVQFKHACWLINHMDPSEFNAVLSKDFRALEQSHDIPADMVLPGQRENFLKYNDGNPQKHLPASPVIQRVLRDTVDAAKPARVETQQPASSVVHGVLWDTGDGAKMASVEATRSLLSVLRSGEPEFFEACVVPIDEATRVSARYLDTRLVSPNTDMSSKSGKSAPHNSNDPVTNFTTDQYKSYHMARFTALLESLSNDADAEMVQKQLQYYLDVMGPGSSFAACCSAPDRQLAVAASTWFNNNKDSISESLHAESKDYLARLLRNHLNELGVNAKTDDVLRLFRTYQTDISQEILDTATSNADGSTLSLVKPEQDAQSCPRKDTTARGGHDELQVSSKPDTTRGHNSFHRLDHDELQVSS
ncbi:polyprotein of Ty1/Copia retrotransposon, partial [uncultured Marinobacter sp.]|uniref:Ty1/Copia family ribonuclease HI n=1 Tax=uncultured Marinobacter sp. TaxID=187379 RepID=UPI002595487E